MSTHFDDHLDDLRLQAYLDGDLPAGEAGEVRAHLDGCARCRSEAEAWEVLFHDLGELSTLSPSPAFRERILAAVDRPAPRAAGVRGLLGRDARAGGSDHVAPGRLQDFLEGRLAARVATDIEGHLADCAVCRSELAAFREVAMALSALPRYAPSPGFSEAVMARFRVQEMAKVVMAPTSRSARLASAARDWARSLIPSTRQGWAAAMGLALGPAVVVALVVQAIFAHPLVTPTSLASYLLLQLRDLAMGASALLARPALVAALESVRPLLESPALLAGSVTALSGLTVAASWTLYRNVFSSTSGEVARVRALR